MIPEEWEGTEVSPGMTPADCLRVLRPQGAGKGVVPPSGEGEQVPRHSNGNVMSHGSRDVFLSIWNIFKKLLAN